MFRSLRPFALFLLALALFGQGKPLSADDLARMKKAGFTEDTILQAIATNGSAIDSSVDGLLALKENGLSDAVIAAALAGSPGASTKSTPSSTGAIPEELGVHVSTNDGLKLLPVEVVTFKTAGMWKAMAFMKASFLGRLAGGRSVQQMSGSLTFVIRSADGTAPSEYQLVPLDPKKSSREFVAGKGGVTGVDLGVANAVSVQFERIGPNTYRGTAAMLAPGEYGFLAPGALSSANVASSGKMYTFGVH